MGLPGHSVRQSFCVRYQASCIERILLNGRENRALKPVWLISELSEEAKSEYNLYVPQTFM